MHLLKRPTDFYSGLFFFVVGSFAAVIAQGYPLGSARNVGIGVFPLVVGSLLAICGMVLIVRAFAGDREERIDMSPLPLVMISAGIAVFALILMGAGLVLAIIALVLLASAASGRFRPVSAMLMALGLAVSCTAGFVYGLGQMLPVFGSWFTPIGG